MRLVAGCLAATLALGCARPHTSPPNAPAASPAIAEETGLRWVADDVTHAEVVGAGPPLMLAAGAGAPGDNLGGRASIPKDFCALFLSRGSASVEDLDLFVYGDDGSILGEDETASATPSVIVCPPHPAQLYAFGRVAAGHGLFAVSEQLVRPGDADRVARSVGADADPREATIAEGGWPDLDDVIAAHRRQLGGTFRDVRRVAVPMDPRMPTRVAVAVEAHQCVDVLVLPGEEIAYVELTVLDAEGRILGRAPTDTNFPAAIVCAEAHGDLSLELRARAGRGLAAVVTSVVEDRKSLDAPGTVILGDPLSSPKLADARKALSDRLAKAGYPPPSFAAQASSAVGRHVSLDVDLPEGCSRLDIVDGSPAVGIDAWLWSAGGTLLSHDDGTARATLFGCSNGHARLDVEALTRNGPFALEVRKAPGATKALTDHPLAAGRVLERLAAAERIATPSDVSTRPIALSAGAIATDDASIPVDRCLDVALGLGPGAEGAELRLLDADGGAELEFVRGAYSALASTCAVGRAAPLHVRIEARVAAGGTDALLTTHVRNESAVAPRTPTISSPPRATEAPAGAR